MYANTHLNPTQINPPEWVCAELSAEAMEQTNLMDVQEDGSVTITGILRREYPEMYSVPAIDPDDFEALYQWFLS